MDNTASSAQPPVPRGTRNQDPECRRVSRSTNFKIDLATKLSRKNHHKKKMARFRVILLLVPLIHSGGAAGTTIGDAGSCPVAPAAYTRTMGACTSTSHCTSTTHCDCDATVLAEGTSTHRQPLPPPYPNGIQKPRGHTVGGAAVSVSNATATVYC